VNRIIAVLGVAFAMFFVAGPAWAQGADDYFTRVSNALKSSPVYVAPGTEGTNGDTSATLLGKLNQDDNIVLVMLPGSALSSINPSAFAARLSTKENNGKIVGLVVGDQTVGYALSLPNGKAADLMHRAASVSANNVETLGTYVQNVHAWVKENPALVTTFVSPPPVSDQRPYPWWGYAAWIGGGLVVAVGLYKLVTSGSSDSQPPKVRFVSSPPAVAELLYQIHGRAELVRDDELEPCLRQCCENTERYFRLYSQYSKDATTDVYAFSQCLTDILKVLDEGYLPVVNNRSDFNDADKRIRNGKTFIMKCAKSIVKLIRDLNDVRLVEYDVAVSYDPENGMSFVSANV